MYRRSTIINAYAKSKKTVLSFLHRVTNVRGKTVTMFVLEVIFIATNTASLELRRLPVPNGYSQFCHIIGDVLGDGRDTSKVTIIGGGITYFDDSVSKDTNIIIKNTGGGCIPEELEFTVTGSSEDVILIRRIQCHYLKIMKFCYVRQKNTERLVI